MTGALCSALTPMSHHLLVNFQIRPDGRLIAKAVGCIEAAAGLAERERLAEAMARYSVMWTHSSRSGSPAEYGLPSGVRPSTRSWMRRRPAQRRSAAADGSYTTPWTNSPVRRVRPRKSPPKALWSHTPAMALGWRAWRAKAVMPATSIDVSAWTRQVTLSGPNQPGSPSAPSTAVGRAGSWPSRATPRGPRPRRTRRTSTGAPTAAQAPAAAPAAVSTNDGVGGTQGSVTTED